MNTSDVVKHPTIQNALNWIFGDRDARVKHPDGTFNADDFGRWLPSKKETRWGDFSSVENSLNKYAQMRYARTRKHCKDLVLAWCAYPSFRSEFPDDVRVACGEITRDVFAQIVADTYLSHTTGKTNETLLCLVIALWCAKREKREDVGLLCAIRDYMAELELPPSDADELLTPKPKEFKIDFDALVVAD